MRIALLAVLLCLGCAAQSLKVYAIDVEGGKATLYVSPSGQTMMVDAGYDGNHNRDADRIAAAARDAGVARIDYLVITHYHADHFGGVAQLAARIPIGTFVDHGPNFETTRDIGELWTKYVSLRSKAQHLAVKAGDRIPIRGIQVDVVTAAGIPIAAPMPGAGARNPMCASYKPLKDDTGENSRSIGIVITLGRFRLSDLGDLYWNQEGELACPTDRIGAVDVYMTTHHAKQTSGAPALVGALAPRAAIMNNGPFTGAAETHWNTIHESPRHPDIWQLHSALNNQRRYDAPKAFVANPKGQNCDGNWVLLTAQPDGAFSIRNSRTDKVKRYPPVR